MDIHPNDMQDYSVMTVAKISWIYFIYYDKAEFSIERQNLFSVVMTM